MANLTVTGTGASPPAGTYVCSTELEAVNLMLATIGEQEVDALGGTFNEALIAEGMLHEISREVQSRGWSFNTEQEYPLTVASSEIAVPTNTLKVIVTGEADYIIQRGSRLYNRTDHTYTFTEDVEATIVFFLAFTDLPQSARSYITLRAARKFQAKLLGADSIGKFTDIDENQAWLTLCAEEVDQGNYSMKSGIDYRLWENRGTITPYGSIYTGYR